MALFEGGSALPVTTGGSGPTEARPAVPVYVVSGDAPVLGQRARRVVVVTSGPVEGGAAIPVYDMGVGAIADGDAALPVFVVSGSLAGGVIVVPLVYLLRDQFTTAQANPITSPRTAEPGPGTITSTDTGAKFSISGGELVVAQGGTSNYVDPQWYSTTTQANAIGLACYARLRIVDTNFSSTYLGLSEVINANPVSRMAHLLEYNHHYPLVAGSQIDHGIAYAAVNVVYTIPIAMELLVISRAPGAIYLHRGRPGQWQVMWVDDAVTATPLYARGAGTTSGKPYKLDEIFTTNDLPAAWKDRVGNVTARTATTSNGSTSTMLADALIYHSITAATGVTQELMVRRVDDSNCWIVRMDQTGATIKLIEVVAGVETERASAAQTWTNATVYRIGVRADTYNIRMHVNGTYKAGYTSCRTNTTATGVKVSHAGTELVTWPARITLDVGTSINTKSILPYGDSKTLGQGDGTGTYPAGQNGYPPYLCDLLATASGQTWREFPYRIGRSGFTAATMQPLIDADIAVRYDAPDYILCNLGINDGDAVNQTLFETNYGYIVDALHAKWPNARIGMARVWKNSGTWNNIDGYIGNIVAARPSYCFLGPDERLILPGPSGIGTEYTVDGIHPNNTGYNLMAAAWKTSMGL